MTTTEGRSAAATPESIVLPGDGAELAITTLTAHPHGTPGSPDGRDGSANGAGKGHAPGSAE